MRKDRWRSLITLSADVHLISLYFTMFHVLNFAWYAPIQILGFPPPPPGINLQSYMRIEAGWEEPWFRGMGKRRPRLLLPLFLITGIPELFKDSIVTIRFILSFLHCQTKMWLSQVS